MKTLKLTISGIVQGVFFRKFIKDNAEELELQGHVRNLDNSKVEAVIQGNQENIKEMIERCKKGSLDSKVKEIEIDEIPNQDFKEFKIIRF